MAKINFRNGRHSMASFAEEFLTPLFEDGTIPEFPGAAHYAICYGELCAYAAPGQLLAIWSKAIPDTKEEVPLSFNHSTYQGTWTSRK